MASPIQARSETPVKRAFNFKHGLPSTLDSKHLRPVLERRDIAAEKPIGSNGPDVNVPGYAAGAFAKGQPFSSSTGKGSVISGTSDETSSGDS